MFRKHFGRRGPGRGGPGSFEDQREHRWRQGPPFGRRQPPFRQPDDEPFWFGPGGRGPFDHPFWRGGPFDEDGGGRRRQRRGDIKYVLLELLAEQPRHGYDLIRELEQRNAGFYRPSPGSVYPTLQMLEEEGHLTSEQVDGKRVYTITESGRQLVEQRRQRPGAEDRSAQPGGFHERGGPALGELRQSAMAFVASVLQVAHHGTPEQIEAIRRLLDTTRREIYAILSREDTTRPD